MKARSQQEQTLDEKSPDSKPGTTPEPPVGLVAGNGEFPLLLLNQLRKQGRSAVVAMISGEAKSEISHQCLAATPVKVGQLGKVVRFFRKHGVRDVVFLGGIRRTALFRTFRPDLLGIKVLSRAISVRDDSILRGVADEFERQGFSVLDPAQFLTESVVQAGEYSGRSLSPQEVEDALIGWEAAKTLGQLDIGQSVVVSDGSVVAVEGIDGTDATIARAGRLLEGSRSKSRVVVKLPKPQQDRRLDLPAVGPGTIDAMRQAGCSALVLEEEGALLLEPTRVSRNAREAGIAVVVFESVRELEALR
jgi:DUF1009 family protein